MSETGLGRLVVFGVGSAAPSTWVPATGVAGASLLGAGYALREAQNRRQEVQRAEKMGVALLVVAGLAVIAGIYTRLKDKP